MNVTQEAQALNVKIEKEPDGTFVAALGGGEEEMVLPGATPEEAILEARAFRAIEQSELYLVNYDETADEYEVSFASDPKATFSDKQLHKAYEKAQVHYAKQFKVAEPTPPVEEAKPNGAGRRRKKVVMPVAETVVDEPVPTPLNPQADRLMGEVVNAFIEAHTKLINALRVILTEEKR